MLWYLVRRLAASCVLILALLTAVFVIIHAAPGDPLDRYDAAGLDRAGRAAVAHQLGLDAPLTVRYWRWISGVALHGDLGTSLREHRPVSDMIRETLPNTLLLTVPAFLLHFLLAVVGGTLLARYRGRPVARAADLAGLAVYSMPLFWLCLLAILLFGRALGWFPVGGAVSPDAEWLGPAARLADRLRHLVLPVVVVGVGSAAGTARYVRSAVEDVLAQDFITAARARGLSDRVVLWRHALRNALLPVITLVGLSLPFLLSGSVVAEIVFAWPGMGWLTLAAVSARDYPVVMATAAIAGGLVVAGNLLADLLYGLADPRVRIAGKGTA